MKPITQDTTRPDAELVRSLAPRVERVVRAVLGAAHPDLDDALQQALIALTHALPAFRGDCDPFGYARVIAVRVAIATRKKARTHELRSDGDVDLDALEAPRALPSDQVSAVRRRETLRALLAELPDAQAETLALRVVFGCSLSEVATRTGAPLNTVRSRLHLAKERLKNRIERDEALRTALDLA